MSDLRWRAHSPLEPPYNSEILDFTRVLILRTRFPLPALALERKARTKRSKSMQVSRTRERASLDDFQILGPKGLLVSATSAAFAAVSFYCFCYFRCCLCCFRCCLVSPRRSHHGAQNGSPNDQKLCQNGAKMAPKMTKNELPEPPGPRGAARTL